MPPLRVDDSAKHARARVGRITAVQTSQASQISQASAWTPPPVGVELLERAGERARIDDAIAALRRGHGTVLVIQGAAGIG